MCFWERLLEAGDKTCAWQGSGQEEAEAEGEDTLGPGGALGVKKWQPTQRAWQESSTDRGSLAGCSPWGRNMSEDRMGATDAWGW